MADVFYWAMVAALFTHELDAMNRHEWRVLPLLRALPEEVGRNLFLLAHLPLFFAVFRFSGSGTDAPFAVGLSLFALVHVGLHWIYRCHPANEFNNPVSWLLICLPAVLASGHLIAVLL